MYTIITEPIYSFLKKNIEFDWTLKQSDFINNLKIMLISSLGLIFIDYLKDADLIILAIDISLEG